MGESYDLMSINVLMSRKCVETVRFDHGYSVASCLYGELSCVGVVLRIMELFVASSIVHNKQQRHIFFVKLYS